MLIPLFRLPIPILFIRSSSRRTKYVLHNCSTTNSFRVDLIVEFNLSSSQHGNLSSYPWQDYGPVKVRLISNNLFTSAINSTLVSMNPSASSLAFGIIGLDLCSPQPHITITAESWVIPKTITANRFDVLLSTYVDIVTTKADIPSAKGPAAWFR